MERRHFVRIVRSVLDTLPPIFRDRIHNVAVLVEDYPPGERARRRLRRRAPGSRGPRSLLMGVFVGVPATRKSVFDLPAGPDHIVLYQKNIEAVCSSPAELRDEIRRTVIHELGHYFGLDEDQLRDV